MHFDDGLEGKSVSDTIMTSEERWTRITMQQNVARLRCNDAVDKTVILFHLPHTRLEIATLSPVHGGSARSHVRDTISGCRGNCR